MIDSYTVALCLLGIWLVTIPVIGILAIHKPLSATKPFRPTRELINFLMLINILSWILMWCFRFW